jgi:hypothetical protein
VVLNSKKFDVNWPGPDNLCGYTGLDYDLPVTIRSTSLQHTSGGDRHFYLKIEIDVIHLSLIHVSFINKGG